LKTGFLMFDFQVLSHYYNPTMPDTPPERRLGDLLKPLGLTLVTAESCTGGLIGHLLTSVSGSSDYYLGGAVTYSNEMKEGLLGVRKTTMIEHGAVSEQTALEMAGSDLGALATGNGFGGGPPHLASILMRSRGAIASSVSTESESSS
jgi:hypothetical protein